MLLIERILAIVVADTFLSVVSQTDFQDRALRFLTGALTLLTGALTFLTGALTLTFLKQTGFVTDLVRDW